MINQYFADFKRKNDAERIKTENKSFNYNVTKVVLCKFLQL